MFLDEVDTEIFRFGPSTNVGLGIQAYTICGRSANRPWDQQNPENRMAVSVPGFFIGSNFGSKLGANATKIGQNTPIYSLVASNKASQIKALQTPPN